MASLDFEAEKQKFRDWYDENADRLKRALTTYKVLITQLLSGHQKLTLPIVSGRIKYREECIAKFSRKYQARCEQENLPYEIRSFLTDILGVRAVCLYESEIDAIRETVFTEFDVVDVTDKSATLEAYDDTFGYKGLHLDLRLKDPRTGLSEYKQLVELPFELQIRTTVQDAWSVLDHKIKYKKNIPGSLKRRINRLAALFELADQEFQNIRNETTTLESSSKQILSDKTQASEMDLITHSVAPDEPLDVFSFLRVAKNYFPSYRFIEYKADGFVSELREVIPELTASDLDSALGSNLSKVEEYRAFQSKRGNSLNPFTCIRHALYFANRDSYQALLFELQRKSFDEWLTPTSENAPD